MKYLMTIIIAIMICLGAVNLLSAQNQNSVQGDFEALQALYNSTQGQDVPTLDSVDNLPLNTNSATYPYMYMINGEIHYLERESHFKQFNESGTANWINAGVPWPDKTGWDNMTPETMGDALGVETDANGRVISIDMWRINPRNNGASNPGYYGNTLAGTLPPEINNLHKIQYFAVKQNFLFGAIPSISNWEEVNELSFAGQDQYLRYDDRSQWHESNHWSGSRKSVVTTNRFLTEIPTEIDGFQNLELIELRHQFLTGTVPAWSDLPSIKAIFLDRPNYVASNGISGTLPGSWGSLTSTVFLQLDGLGLTGDFPQSIEYNWADLSLISIAENSFTGPIPEFLNARDKRYVYMVKNEFTGGFPSGYFHGDNSELNKFSIGFNDLGGELPQTVPSPSYPNSRDRYRVASAGIGGCNFEGELPIWIQDFFGMQTIYLVGNNFSGDFPKTAAEGNNMKTFYISGNSFSGVLPDVSWGSRKNPWIYIDRNNFEGEIPDSWISIFAGPDDNMPWVPAEDANGDDNYNTFTPSDGTLTWNAVTDAVAYEVDIRDLNDNRVRDLTIIGTSVEVTGLPTGTYKWRVRGLNWYSGQMGQVRLSDNNLSGRIPDWALNMDSWYYSFELDRNRYTFRDIGPVYDAFKAKFGDKLKIGNQKPFGNEQNRTMPEGEDVVFDLSDYDYRNNSYQWLKDGIPIEGATSPILTITTVSDADEGSYVLEVKNSDLVELGTHQSQPIYFRIGENDGGNSGGDANGGDDSGSADDGTNDNEPTQKVFPAAPVPLGPDSSSSDVSLQPQISWSSVEGADYYIFHMSASNPSEMVIDVIVEDTVFVPTEPLAEDRAHQWRVRGVKNGGEGDWSPIWTFSTTEYIAPEPPYLLSPENREEYETLTPTFEWVSVDSADYYVVHVIENSQFKSTNGSGADEVIVIEAETFKPIYTTADSLEAETNYIWRVRAVNGEQGEWSEEWEFTTPAEGGYVSTKPAERPFETSLSQNYPNPFNPSTQIEFSLNEAQKVSMNVYDMAGREVASLVNDVLNAGRHSISFDAGHLSSGIYFYRFVTRNRSFTKKMTLVK